MVAPMLPGADGLASLLKGKIDRVLIDRMNYHYGDWVYKKHCFDEALTDRFFGEKGRELASAIKGQGIECEELF